jgi:integrase
MQFNALCDCYLDEYAGRKKTAGEDRRMIDTYIRPRLGSRSVQSIRFKQIHALHASMAATPYQANRVLSLISKLINIAGMLEVEGLGANPCKYIKRFPEKKRRRYLSNTEAKAVCLSIWARFERQPLECGLLLLELYTGARPGELKTATWSMLQGERLEHDDTKTGQRTIYLPPQALSVLARLPRTRQWIIGPDVSARYVWASVLGETGIRNLRMYDLRHSFASFGLDIGLSFPQLQELMGHASPTTTMRYAHLAPDRGAASVNAIGERINANL